MLPPLTALGVNAGGQKSLTMSVESLVKALDPFAKWDAEELANWLKIAQTYRDTGRVPEPLSLGRGRKKETPASKTVKAAKKSTAEVVESLRTLQARPGGLNPEEVKAEIDTLETLTVAQLKEVQKEFLSVVIGKSKTELLAAIRKRVNDHHATRDRVDGILAQ